VSTRKFFFRAAWACARTASAVTTTFATEAPFQFNDRIFTMPSQHAVVLIDHYSAKIVRFGTEHSRGTKVNEHLHLHGPNEKNQRARHEFFGKVCDGLADIAQVLIVGGHTSTSDFRHFVANHRPETDLQLFAYQVVDRPSEKELVALARKWFSNQELMAGIAA
jgi:hypothetical protein